MHHYEHFYLDPKFWVGVSFVIFLLLVGRKAWAQLTGMLDARAERVRAELAEAARLREEAEAMLRQAEADRTAAAQEAKAMAQQAQDASQRSSARADRMFQKAMRK